MKEFFKKAFIVGAVVFVGKKIWDTAYTEGYIKAQLETIQGRLTELKNQIEGK